jgi:peptide-methionine (R)-S-oxide reductase
MDTTKDEWRTKLTPEQYSVLREGATEAPFTGTLLSNKETGDYTCAACGNILFESGTKFESGSGWPSFYDAKHSAAIKLVHDNSGGMSREEVRCARCDSHLGHMFEDAPDQPTGKRFCINSCALNFEKGNGND